jgi:hypothetical protein
VTLRVVGGDEKGSLKSETVKFGLKSQGTWTRERLRWQGPAAHTKDRPNLSSERAPHKNKTVTVTQVIKIWSYAPDGCFIPRQTGRLTVSRNIKTQTHIEASPIHVLKTETSSLCNQSSARYHTKSQLKDQGYDVNLVSHMKWARSN